MSDLDHDAALGLEGLAPLGRGLPGLDLAHRRRGRGARDEPHLGKGRLPMGRRDPRRFLVALSLAGAVAGLAACAKGARADEGHPRQMRGSAKQVRERLIAIHQEHPVAGGLLKGGVLQVFATEDGSTGTLVLTNTAGIWCIPASGRWWTTEIPKSVTPGDPS